MRQLLRVVEGLGRRFADQRLKRVERIEEHMGIQLILERLVLMAQALHTQFLVLHDDALLLDDQMNDITAPGDDTTHDEIAQRMQVVVHHCVDGRDIELMVKPYEELSEQTARGPCQQERQHHFGRRHANQRRVEAENTPVDPEEQEQRNKCEQNLVDHVRRFHVGEQGVLLETVRKRKHLREMDQHGHYRRDDQRGERVPVFE